MKSVLSGIFVAFSMYSAIPGSAGELGKKDDALDAHFSPACRRHH